MARTWERCLRIGGAAKGEDVWCELDLDSYPSRARCRPRLRRTITLHVPVTNTLLVDAVWAHNDISLSALSSTGT